MLGVSETSMVASRPLFDETGPSADGPTAVSSLSFSSMRKRQSERNGPDAEAYMGKS